MLRKIMPWCAPVLALFSSTVPAAAVERGIMITPGTIYVSPSADSAKLSDIGRGREVAVTERTPNWLNVVGTVEVSPDPENESDRNVTVLWGTNTFVQLIDGARISRIRVS